MGFKINKSVAVLYLFFLIYFITYLGERTGLKYASIVILQLYIIFRTGFPRLRDIDPKLRKIVLLICLALTISFLFNFSLSGAIKTLSLIDLFILSLMMPRFLNKSKINELHLIKIIIESLLLALVIAFFTKYNDIIIALGRSSTASVRHLFGFGYPSIVGFLCYVEFVLSSYLFFSQRKKMTQTLFYIFSILFSFYMAYLADIRAAMISMILFIMVYMYNFLPKTRTFLCLKVILFSVFFICSLLYLIGASINIENLNYIFSDRFVYYGRAITDVLNKGGLIFGIGAFRNSDVTGLNRIQIDNSFIDIFYQYGIIVLLGFVSMIVIMFLKIRKIGSTAVVVKEKPKKYDEFINSYFVSVLVYSMVEKNLFSLSSARGLVTFLLIFLYIEKYKNIASTFC